MWKLYCFKLNKITIQWAINCINLDIFITWHWLKVIVAVGGGGGGSGYSGSSGGGVCEMS